MNNFTPIILFVYNKPEYTKCLIEYLRQYAIHFFQYAKDDV